MGRVVHVFTSLSDTSLFVAGAQKVAITLKNELPATNLF
jgi:hypothetical protein